MNEKLLVEFANFVKDSYNIPLVKEQLDKFNQYLIELISWNKRFNLTRINDKKEILYLHFVDSLSASIVFRQNNIDIESAEIKIVDVGPGAGFPSLPLKITYPSLDLTLIESKKKKCFFLEHIIKKLDLGIIKILNTTAEICGHNSDYRGNFSISLCRALSKIGKSLELAAPLVKLDGFVLLWITEQQQNKFNQYQQILSQLGLELLSSTGYMLPGIIQNRYIAVLRKICNTPSKYPRSRIYNK